MDPDAPPNGPDDLIIGPLVYQGAVLAFQGPDLPGPAPEPDADGVTRFKTGAALPPDTTVTVSIAGSARSYAGIATEDGPNAGFWQVTYVSCPQQKRSSRMWWVGGFTLLDRGSGCVPVDVQVRGEKKVRHAFVALNVAPCHQ